METTSHRARLLSLGTRDLARPRLQRPDRTVSVETSELPEADVERLKRLYRFVLGIHDRLIGRLDAADVLEELGEQLEPLGFADAHQQAGQLGRGARRRDLEPRLRKAYHDLRGGSLLSLLMHLEMVQLGHGSAEDAARIFILARDQLKIMRNAVSDLDTPRYQADLQDKDHAVDLLREKWASVAYRLPQRGICVELDCDFDGVIASCCMEFSTLDRVIYNLVNNAAQHSADGAVELSILPIDEADETLLRIVVANRVDDAQRKTLRHRFGDELGQIFRGGFSTSDEGHGLGLRICGDLVAHGFSLPSVPFAVDHGYLGATLLEERFVAWFHWPARKTTPPIAS